MPRKRGGAWPSPGVERPRRGRAWTRSVASSSSTVGGDALVPSASSTRHASSISSSTALHDQLGRWPRRPRRRRPRSPVKVARGEVGLERQRRSATGRRCGGAGSGSSAHAGERTGRLRADPPRCGRARPVRVRSAAVHDLDVVGIGNALVDVITHDDDDVPRRRRRSSRASMTLIDTDRADGAVRARWARASRCRAARRPTRWPASPASAAGRLHRQGRRRPARRGVRPRPPGRRRRLRDAAGHRSASPTGRCLIVVTPDAQRTMNTYLGVSALLGPDDVDADLVAAGRGRRTSRATCSTGPRRKEAYRKAAAGAHAAGRQGVAHAVRLVLRRAPPRRLPRPRRRRRSTSCSPTRTSSARCTRSPTSTTPSEPCAGHCEIAAITRGQGGSVVVARRRASTSVDAASRRPRWSTPPAPATSTPPASCTASPTGWPLADVRPARARWPPPRSSPTSAPAVDVARRLTQLDGA